MSQDSLVKMANDIAAFFRAEPVHEEAVGGIVNHISRYWTPRMREKLVARIDHGDPGLDALALEAARRLAAQMRAAAQAKPRA
ncbi:MAG: formate dehydrogenase subunit delta [Gammaproteobacteria bacterium]|nr:formate dehydrogenase subunit delta [Gammaproteobacteria bacterium]